MQNPLIHLRPFSALLVLLLILLASTLIFTALALVSGLAFFPEEVVYGGADAIDHPLALSWLRLNQLISQVGVFVLPPLLLAMLLYGLKGIGEGLGLRTKSPFRSWMAGILFLFAAIPFVNVLMEWNMALHLPESLQALENWLREQEETANALSQFFLDDASLQGLLLNILIVVLMPAFGEELLFRAGFQPLFIRWLRNPHLGIFLAALFFSALHLQFFGFFPRLLLGLVLGYAYYWTRNLWIPVLMHLINNLTIVLVSWASARNWIRFDESALTDSASVYALIPATLLLFLAVYWLLQDKKRSLS